MKKLSFLLVIALSLTGCTTADILAIDGSRHFQVLQVIDGGALALRCDELTGTTCTGMAVFIPDSVDPEMYDEKIVFMKTPTVVDRYSYTTVQERQKTVPVFIDQKINNVILESFSSEKDSNLCSQSCPNNQIKRSSTKV